MHFLLRPCSKERKDRRSFSINFPCTRFRRYILFRIFPRICRLNCDIIQRTSVLLRKFLISEEKIQKFPLLSQYTLSFLFSIFKLSEWWHKRFHVLISKLNIILYLCFVDLLFTLLNLNKLEQLKFAKKEKYAYKRNSMKRSYFLSRKFLFDKIKVCTLTSHGAYICISALNIVYIMYGTRVCVKSYQDRAIFNVGSVVTWKGCHSGLSRFSSSISERLLRDDLRYVLLPARVSKCREMDLDALKHFPFLVRNTGALIARRGRREKWRKRSFQGMPIHGISLITETHRSVSRSLVVAPHTRDSGTHSEVPRRAFRPFSSFLCAHISPRNLMRNSMSAIVSSCKRGASRFGRIVLLHRRRFISRPLRFSRPQHSALLLVA